MENAALEAQSKLPGLETTIFTVMARLANKHQAINLAQGFPNFGMDAALIERVLHYMREGKNQYAPMGGVPQLTQALANKVEQLYKVQVDPKKEITVTAGGTQALFASIMALVHPGDEVILFEPAYDSYAPAVKLAGGTPIYISLTFPEYSIPWEQVAAAMSSKTKMLIINSPHNPSGRILSEADIEALKELTQQNEFYILCDEVYEHLVYEGKTHQSMLAYPELRAKSICTYSFGKVFNNTGWKTGYFIAPPDLTYEIRKVHQFEVFSVNTPIQYALADFLTEEQNYLGLSSFFEKKRDFFADKMNGSKFKLLPCEGSYFQLADYSAISEKGDLAFATELIETIGVASIPVSAFYHNKEDNKVLRFCYAKDEATLSRATEKLCEL